MAKRKLAHIREGVEDAFGHIEEVSRYQNGKMVIVCDDEDRVTRAT